MKKILFCILAVTLVVLSSCGGADPKVFNDTMVNANNKILDVKLAYDNQVTKAVRNNDFTSIIPITDSALVKIDAELAIVEAVKVPKGGDAFKETSLKTFKSIRDIVEAGKKFTSLTENSTPEEFNAIEKEYNEKEAAYSTAFAEMSKAQAEYISASGYKLQ